MNEEAKLQRGNQCADVEKRIAPKKEGNIVPKPEKVKKNSEEDSIWIWIERL